MRQALVPGNRIQRSMETITIPAPSGGLNTRDSVLAMPPTDARVLINAIARSGEIEVREGSVDWSTGLGTDVQTLMAYNGAAGTNKLFAATATAIYDVTTQGAVGAAAVSSLTGGKWQYVNFANAFNNWLVAVNGADNMRVFDGSSWTSTADFGTGVHTHDMVDVTVYQKRLFFLRKDTRVVYYLAAGAISGTGSLLALETLMKRGGYIQAIGTWTVDAGDGLDDLFVAITSEGEAIVYSGIDPSSTSDWQLKGVYYVGKPLGRRCLFKIAAELVVITDRGLYPMSRALSESAVKREGFISDKINNLIFTLARDYGSNFGWQAEISTSDNVAVVNVPGKATTQLVMDLTTYGWSVFEGWDAECWQFFGGDLYYGTAGKVVKALTGEDDNGSMIYSIISPAFLGFGNLGQQKHVKLMRPLFVSELPFTYRIGVTVDLEVDQVFTTSITEDIHSLAEWDSAVWDSAVWGGSLLTKQWHTVAAMPGSFLSVYLKLQKKGSAIKFVGVDYALQRGGVL